MKGTKRTIIRAALAGAIATTLLVDCNRKGDSISIAEQADKKAGVAAPGIEETKAIAEEGFIYGLPIVMNYAVMNEFCVIRTPASTRGHSTRSVMRRVSLPTRTRRSSRPTAT